MELQEMKKAVDEYGRKRMADEIGMPYASMSNKLNGYTAMTVEEIAKIEGVLDAKRAN